jgi:DNA topoisomerase-3
MGKRVAGRSIGAPLAGVLLARRKSQVLRGFQGKAASASRQLSSWRRAARLRFDFQAPDGAAPALKTARALETLACPRSTRQGTVMAGRRGWGCTRWREGCSLVIWFETAGRRLTPAQLRDLVVRGKTRKARFAPGGGPAVEGRLVLDPAAAGGSARFEPA